jgi:hypothetical protein
MGDLPYFWLKLKSKKIKKYTLHPIYRFGPPTYPFVRSDGPGKSIFNGHGEERNLETIFE